MCINSLISQYRIHSAANVLLTLKLACVTVSESIFTFMKDVSFDFGQSDVTIGNRSLYSF